MSINNRAYQLWELKESCKEVSELIEKDLSLSNERNEHTTDKVNALRTSIDRLYPKDKSK